MPSIGYTPVGHAGLARREEVPLGFGDVAFDQEEEAALPVESCVVNSPVVQGAAGTAEMG